MGNLCSKRKGSDSISIKSEASNKKGSAETLENHSESSKRPNQNGGKSQSGAERSSGTEATPSTIAAETPEPSLQAKDSLRSRIIRDAEPSSVSGDSMSLSSPTMMNPPHVPDFPLPAKLPQEIKNQSENIKNLLIGRIQKVKPVIKSRKITLYICAADSQDFRLEKGHLQTEVYPDLREYCSSRDYELHITDLHWKTDMEMKQDHDFPELCLGELKRQEEVSYLIPILFLSNSLGAPLLPKTMEQQDFEMALSNVTDLVGKGLLEKWYKLDTHAQPQCYRLSSILEHIPQIQSENADEKATAISTWQRVVEDILNIMLRVFPTELRDTYLTTVIEQEIHNSIFMSRDVGKRSLWTSRSFTGKPSQSPDTLTPTQVEKNRRIETLHRELKSQLTSDRILKFSVKWKEGGISSTDFEHRKYLLDVSNQLSIHLRSVIDEIIEEEKNKGKWKPCYGVSGNLCSEIMQHTVFSQQAAKCCLSFENVVNDIKMYIGTESASSTHPLIVHGQRGCGKTCFLSRVIQQAPNWYPESVLVHRFVGLTPESRSLVQLLRTVTSQVSFLLMGRNYWIPHNAKCYLRELYKMVSTSTSVFIVIDGLDELSTRDASALDWLSEPLPPKIKLIISCSDDTPVFQVIKSRIQQQKAFIPMPSLSLLSAESMLTASILQYSHSVDSDLQKRLCSRLNHCALPLYIKVLAWQAAIDRQGLVDISQVTTVVSAIHFLFDYLEKVLGAEKVGLALGFLCASRNGLCDSELLDLLAHSSNFSSKLTFVDWAPASIFLAQLFQLLGPFLEWGVSGEAFVVRWRDSTLYDLAKQRYIGIPEVAQKARKTLGSYFEGELQDIKNGRFVEWSSGSNVKRVVDEVPYQKWHLHGSIKTSHLCNLDWLLKKLENSTVFNVLEDIGLEDSTDDDVTLLRQCLELSASSLSYDVLQFYGQLYNRLLPYFNEPDSKEAKEWSSKCPFMKHVFEFAKSPKTPCFVPLSSFLQSPKDYDALIALDTFSFRALDDGEVFFNEVYRMKLSNQFVVSLSTAKEEVIVWDVYSEATVRTLKGVHNPISLKVIDEHRCVILCGRELLTYNVDNGTFMTKLKGVMNQKMPFYGLHDENHIVAISRNRMYVNLMNLDTGDCITTFKVGEDRFLNSLIVSENGRLLVCGDETQKPFPLLVWDLPSRKLLYDLRIPHHEFVTSLAAITKEGHFVCCVCREVDDPGPNFIVVYDLQSGTLFKKWKPGFSTQAIAISAQGGCVINALEDNRIIVWDLVTGTSQWSLEKHIAPPDILKLDDRGSRCLSCDSTGRDRSVILWDVTSGSLLAIYTPDSPLTACEVFNNGDGVILGLKGRSEIATLTFQDAGDGRVAEKYGSDEHHGKVTILQTC